MEIYKSSAIFAMVIKSAYKGPAITHKILFFPPHNLSFNSFIYKYVYITKNQYRWYSN